MDTEDLFQKSLRILQSRLTGLQAVALYDVPNTGVINCTLFVTPERINNLAVHISDLVCGIGRHGGFLDSRYGPLRYVAIQAVDGLNRPTHYVAIPLSTRLWLVVIATDQIGDICFHCIWSEEDGLGINHLVKQAISGVRLKAPGGNKTFDTHPTVVLKPLNKNLDATLNSFLRQGLHFYCCHAAVQHTDNSSTSFHSGDGWRNDDAQKTGDFCQSVLLSSIAVCRNDIGGDNRKLSWLWIAYGDQSTSHETDVSGALYIVQHHGRWLVAECYSPTGRLGNCVSYSGADLYWLRHEDLGQQFSRKSSRIQQYPKVSRATDDQNWIAHLDQAGAGCEDLFILAIGSMTTKLPWYRPLVYTSTAEIGEFLGLSDIGTTLAELAEQLLKSEVPTIAPIELDHIVVQGSSGCFAIAIVNETIALFLACNDRNHEKVLAGLLKARDSHPLLRQHDNIANVQDHDSIDSGLFQWKRCGYGNEFSAVLDDIQSGPTTPHWIGFVRNSLQASSADIDSTVNPLVYEERIGEQLLKRTFPGIVSLRAKLNVFSTFAIKNRIGTLQKFRIRSTVGSTISWDTYGNSVGSPMLSLIAAFPMEAHVFAMNEDHLAALIASRLSDTEPRPLDSSHTPDISFLNFKTSQGYRLKAHDDRIFHLTKKIEIATIEVCFNRLHPATSRIEIFVSSHANLSNDKTYVYAVELRINTPTFEIRLENPIRIAPRETGESKTLYLRCSFPEGTYASPQYEFRRVQNTLEKLANWVGGFRQVFVLATVFASLVVLAHFGYTTSWLLNRMSVPGEIQEAWADLLKVLVPIFAALCFVGVIQLGWEVFKSISRRR